MTAIALPNVTSSAAHATTASTGKSLGALAMPTVAQVGVGVVDMAGRSVEAVEQAAAECKGITDEVVPATTRFVGGFFLPEIINYQVARVVSMATRLGTTVVTSGGNALLNAMTFGAPTWLKTARQTLATSSETLEQPWNSASEFLARCLAENSERNILRDDLISYVETRKQLRALVERHGEDAPEVQGTRDALMQQESSLKDYKDYQMVKDALEQGIDFVRKNHEHIITLAEKTADSILKRAENYYIDRVGSFGSKIEGGYKNMTSDSERLTARNELRDRIAVKLKQVFTNELQKDEVKQSLQAVRSELLESFGAYRQGVSALSYVALGVAYYTGGLSYLVNEALTYAVGVKEASVAYLSGVVSEAWSTATQFAWDNTFGAFADGLSAFWDAMKQDMPYFMRRYLGF